MKQSPFDFGFELVVDSFAGGGGASTGIELALGRPVDIAVNHDEEALSMHAVNHPDTVHLREDVWAINPHEVMGHRQIGLLWASPDCKHFSKAKGGKPVSKRIRGLAWVVCKWAQETKPRVIIMENVEEFQTWGPLVQSEGGWQPDPTRKGETFERFTARLRRLGYKVEWKALKACDYGAPTIRKRLFLIARRDGRPIVWPKATHGKGLIPYLTAADCIDWSIPCPSIFERKKPLADATLRRIARGVMRYVIESDKPFIVQVANYGKEMGGVRDSADPLSTITANPKGGSHAIVVPHITKFRNGATGAGADEPVPTVTANSFIKRPGGSAPLGLVAAHLSKFSENSTGQMPDEPMHTVMAGAPRHAVVSAHLQHLTHHGERRGNDLQDPVPTVTGAHRGEQALISATLVQTGYGEREGQQPRAMDVEKPLGTIVAGGGKAAVVAAFLAQHNKERDGFKPGRKADDPFSTITASGTQQNVVTSHLVKLRGTCPDGQPVDEPAPTTTAGGNHVGEVRAFLVAYYGNDKEGVDMKAPLRTVPTHDRFGLVMVHGEPYEIVDIGMRMLTPRELARAQGFPDGYVIDRGGDGRTLTKTAQVRMIGNSVCPPVAAALVRANFKHEEQLMEAA